MLNKFFRDIPKMQQLSRAFTELSRSFHGAFTPHCGPFRTGTSSCRRCMRPDASSCARPAGRSPESLSVPSTLCLSARISDPCKKAENALAKKQSPKKCERRRASGRGKEKRKTWKMKSTRIACALPSLRTKKKNCGGSFFSIMVPRLSVVHWKNDH